MDKYEFNLKVEQIQKLVGDRDYVTAMKVVDSIDWNRVRNTNLLTLAASVYEENGKLDKAMDLLSAALERAPVGKRILYKLTELSVRNGDVEKAEDYYHEYNSVAPTDPNCLVLQYMILKVKHAPYQQLIQCLELYNQYEPDEKWMYELATTYESAGRIQDCVNLCDRIAVMFGDTPYAVKALKLKQKFTKLSDEQRALLYPNSIANAGVHYVKNDPNYVAQPVREQPAEPEMSRGDKLAAERYENEDEVFAAYALANGPIDMPVTPVRKPDIAPVPVRHEEPAPAPVRYEEPVTVKPQYEEPPVTYAEEPGQNEAEEKEPVNAGFIVPDEPQAEEEKEYLDTDYTDNVTVTPPFVPASVKDPDAETLIADAQIASAKIESPAPKAEPEKPRPQARTTFTVSEPATQAPEEKAPSQPAPAPAPVPAPTPAPAPAPVKAAPGYHLIIEAEDDQEGLDIAVDELKLVHAKLGVSNGAIKTTGEKLMEKGLSAKAAAKIIGKDFVIEHAGEIEGDVADTIYEFLIGDGKNTNVVLIDNGDGLDRLEEDKPEIFDVCTFITDEEAREKDYTIQEAAPAPAPAPAPVKETREPEPEPVSDETRVITKKPQNVPLYEPADSEEVMSTDDFAQYCCKYASDIDCTITGKSMLALYERIELMEEDGIALTKKAAEDLIEDTADRAEKPPLGKRISGIFKSRYDKDGLLILKEEDFIY